MPAQSNQQQLSYLTLHLAFEQSDNLALSQGLETLALTPDDSDIASQYDGLASLVKWVIKGQGEPQYINQDTGSNTLLPSGGNYYCVECMTYRIDHILQSGGSGYNGSYNWMSYAAFGIHYSIEDGQQAEQLQCNVHNDCIVSIDEYVSSDGYGEKCITVNYSDGHEVTGLYCEVYNQPPGVN